MSFKLSPKVNPPTVFLARWSELTDRFDPAMVLFRRKLHSYKYPVKPLRKLFSEQPQYGAGERGIERISMDQPRYVRITDIDEFGILSNELGVTAEIVDPRYLLKEDDLLIARSGNTVGKSYIHKKRHVSYSCFYAGYLIRFRFNDSIVTPDYVFAITQLPYYKKWVEAIKRPAGQPNINAQEYSSLQIPVPDRAVQDKVVKRLNDAYEVKRIKEKNASELLEGIDVILIKELGIKLPPEPPNTIKNRIFKRRFSDVTGNRFDPIANQPKVLLLRQALEKGKYKTKPLGEEVVFRKDIVDEIGKDETYIGLENIDGSSGEYIASKEKESISSAVKFSKGEILFPKLRPYLNKTHFAEFSGICSTEFHILRSKNFLPRFLFEMLRSKSVVSLTSLLMTGNTLPRLQVADIKSIPMPIPPVKIQERLVNKAYQIRRDALNMYNQASIELEKSKKEIELLLISKKVKS